MVDQDERTFQEESDARGRMLLTGNNTTSSNDTIEHTNWKVTGGPDIMEKLVK